MADTLFYIPSNNCARVMAFIRLNGLEDTVSVKSPWTLAKDEYRRVNPLGKYPALVTAEGLTVFESQVILEYLADRHSARLTERCQPSSLEGRTKARLLVRVHDMYVSGPNCTQAGYFANQSVLYKAEMPLAERRERIVDLDRQLDVIEGLLDGGGDFAAGSEISLADCVLYPTWVFVVELAPVAIGWAAPLAKRPKTAKWYAHVERHPVLGTVGAEVHGFCNMMRGYAEEVAARMKV